MSNGVYTRRDGPHRTVVSTSFDDALYAPEMDNMEDRLEEARQNRTGFYRKMLASRSRPHDDYSVTRRTTYRSGGSPVKEPSISDTVQSGPLPQIPEPHSSWRFYTSYDNGEWKRHAVPVHKEEEEILREPTKVVRRVRETERSSQSPPVESSLRRMRQSGGPLVACLQPRPRRSSEGQRTTTTVQTVNGQPMVVGGEFEGQFGGQFEGMLPEEWEKIVANGSVVRRFSDGGTEYLILQEEPIQGSMKQECTTKYTSTVKVTQPKGSHHVRSGFAIEQGKGGVAGGGGGMEAGQGLVKGEEPAVRKSSRPRIYGFQEKIIIPTKYKNMENEGNGMEGQKENDINTGQSKTREETTVKKSSFVEDGLKGREKRVGVGVGEAGGGGRIQGTEESQSGVVSRLKSGHTALDRSMEGKTVKVVVMNSGSDVESDRKSSEPLSSGEENEAKDPTAARKSSAGISESFIQMPNLFQDGGFPMEDIRALHESLHAKLLPGGAASVTDQAAGSVSTIDDEKSLVPNQRVFSKDEQTFSEVGPGGAKCDGKVLRTYEVITTTDEDDSTIENKLLPTTTKEIIIVPIEAGQQRSPFLKTRAITSSAGEDRTIIRSEDRTTRSDTRELSGRHFPSEQETLSPPRKTIPAVSPKADDKKATDIFEQTGSLFKTITPRPRSVREKESSVFAAREEHLRKAAAGESVHPKLGGVTSRTIRISSNHHDDFKPEFDAFERGVSGRVGTGVSPVRTKVEYVTTERSSQLRPSGLAEGKTLVVRDSFGVPAAREGDGLSQSNTNSGVRMQQGWSTQTQTTRSSPRTGQTERDWDVQVALKE